MWPHQLQPLGVRNGYLLPSLKKEELSLSLFDAHELTEVAFVSFCLVLFNMAID